MFTGVILEDLLAWRALSKAQRRYVHKNYIHQLLNSGRYKLVKMAYLFPVLWCVMLGADGVNGMPLFLFYLFVLFFVVDELVGLLLISLNKQKVDHYIQTHAEELAAVG